MFANLRSKLIAMLFVGMTWLGSHGGCDSGALYNSVGGYFGDYGYGGYGGYYGEEYYYDEYYYDDAYYGGGYYDPYGGYYDPYGGWGWW